MNLRILYRSFVCQGYQTEPRPIHTSTPQEHKKVEYVPVPSPSPAIPINLAPGPNTKVTTTIKTYTYELPGAPENYLPGSNVSGSVVLPGDQTITYTLPKTNGTTTDKTVTYQTVTENVPGHPKYSSSPSPSDVTKKSTTVHKEAKFYREEQHHGTSSYGGGQPVQSIYSYHTGPSPTNTETKTTVTQKYYQVDGNYPNGHGPGDATIKETRSRTFNRFDEYGSRQSSGRYTTADKPDTPTRTTVKYYSQQGTPSEPNTTIYKYLNTTTTIPPNKNADDHEMLLPKRFPTGVQVYPAKPVINGQGPPTKLEDLMASFSDSEVMLYKL